MYFIDMHTQGIFGNIRTRLKPPIRQRDEEFFEKKNFRSKWLNEWQLNQTAPEINPSISRSSFRHKRLI